MKKGMSLIVLVIAILVIIILAGSVILSLVNNNPIQRANEATFKTNIDMYNSELTMFLANKYLQDNSFSSNTFNAGRWNGTGNGVGSIKEYIKSINENDGLKFEIQSSKLVYVGTDDIEENWLTQIGVAIGEITPPTVLGTDVIATVNTTFNGENAAYNNPIIPKGFKAINDGTVWGVDSDKGLVIEDESGNQFVWVPVNVAYSRNFTYPKCYAATDLNTIDDSLPSGVLNEINQIDLYGGFYIARYEAGKENVDTLVSKKGSSVWNKVIYSLAKTKAESMYTSSFVKSGLVTGTQWDMLMKWLDNSNINVIDSRNFGNYNNCVDPANVTGYGSLKVTGFCENWKANNIYDLAGNAFEWTSEVYGVYRNFRGGSYNSSGSSKPASYRDYGVGPGYVYDEGSFRVVLYIL